MSVMSLTHKVMISLFHFRVYTGHKILPFSQELVWSDQHVRQTTAICFVERAI